MKKFRDDLFEPCDIRRYEDLPLTMIMLQGWFSDQHECFKLFRERLTPKDQSSLFVEASVLESVKEKYKVLWNDRTFREMSTQGQGVHKLPGQLRFRSFAWWAACVTRAVAEAGNLESLIKDLHTVEEAHDKFKPWFYKTRKVRNLNAADAARLLARYGFLKPEERPILARGALRGAAILLNDEPQSKKRDQLENEYQDQTKRLALEEKAAAYINDCPELAKHGEWRMEEGENWFCNVVHKGWYPE